MKCEVMMRMIVGLLIGLSSGVFIGMMVMSLCIASSRTSREEEKDVENSK